MPNALLQIKVDGSWFGGNPIRQPVPIAVT